MVALPVSELLKELFSKLSTSQIKSLLVNSDISARITQERINRGMSQGEFAELLGVSVPKLNEYEHGYDFKISELSSILDKLDMDYSINITHDRS